MKMEKSLVSFTNDELALLENAKMFFTNHPKVSFSLYGTIQEWNTIREYAKEKYPEKIISALDGSGFITEWMTKRK
jgi:hypothetical protein